MLQTHASTIGIGQGSSDDEETVGRQSATDALAGLAAGAKPGWALAFCGGRLDGQRVFAALRAVWGDIPIIGGAAIGTITRESVSYSGLECAVALFPDAAGKPTLLTEPDLMGGEEEAGARLGGKIAAAAPPGAAVILIYDSVRSSPPPVLHTGSRLVDGIYRGLNGTKVHLVGGGTISDFRLSDSFIFDGGGFARHAATAVILPPDLAARTIIAHGCVPVGSFMEVTRIEGAVLYELDGRPALDALERMVGGPIDSQRAKDLFLRVTLGEKHGDPFADFDESAYVNRLIVSADPETRSLTLFEADFHVGSRVQFMARDNDLMFESVKRRATALTEEVAGKFCVLGLYIDCAGRSAAASGSETEEANVLLDCCPPGLPILGFYSGVEIAPLIGRSRPLDWTGVLTVIYQNDA